MNSLFEALDKKVGNDISVRRYNLSDMISESYSTLYKCEEGTNLKKLAESHLEDVRKNPKDIDRLSRQLCIMKELVSLEESGEINDSDLVESKRVESRRPIRKRHSEKMQESAEVLTESVDDDDELTDEELEELTKHLEAIRKEKKEAATKAPEKKEEMTEEVAPRKGIRCKTHEAKTEDLDEEAEDKWVQQYTVDILYKEGTEDVENRIEMALHKAGLEVLGVASSDTSWSMQEYGITESTEEDCEECNESKSYTGLQNFKKQSESKAFYKTFKKMNDALKEGKALTRKESIDLYKASNSALTQLSIELEHNPEFLDTFKESVSILSKDVTSLLESLTRGKAPSKKTMKSLAKFSEALLYEAEEDEYEEEEIDDIDTEDIPVDDEATEDEDFVGDDEGDIQSEEAEAFDQEYAEERVELHKELVAEHGDDEDPEIQEKIAQDEQEVLGLEGITDEQIAEITDESEDEEEEPAEEEEPEADETEDEEEDEAEVTDDELAELKKYLSEMRQAKRARE